MLPRWQSRALDTEFHKITSFNGLGKAAATREIGAVVAIMGRLHYSSWDDNGITRYGVEIIAETSTSSEAGQGGADAPPSLPAWAG